MSVNLIENNRKIRGIRKLTEFEIYALFLALPDSERIKKFGFKTDVDFADKYELNNQSLTALKDNDQLWALRSRFTGEFRKYTANVIYSLYRGIIERGTASDCLIWMKIVEDWKEKENNHMVQIKFK